MASNYYDNPNVNITKYIQWPDLTECTSSYQFMNDQLTEKHIQSIIKTEFAFCTTAISTVANSEHLTKHGFKPISAMNNWYWSHHGNHRMMIFWWRQVHEGKRIVPQMPKPARYCGRLSPIEGDIHTHDIQASGCGFKIAQPPLSVPKFYRFFTMLRMPLEVRGLHRRWLASHNFRQFATGTMATYWANGWDAETYSWKAEAKYWEKRKVSTDAQINIEPKNRPTGKAHLARLKLQAGMALRAN